jgi:hypothetical protein
MEKTIQLTLSQLEALKEMDEYLSHETYEKGKPVHLNSVGANSILHQKLKEILSHLKEVKNDVTNDKNGVSLIGKERLRQTEKEGWTPEHDQLHNRGELAKAAACYAVHHTDAKVKDPNNILEQGWPWDDMWWKPSPDKIRNLVKAGALIAAEIDRLLNSEQDVQECDANGLNQGTEPMAQNKSADKTMKWVKASERLPKEEKAYYVRYWEHNKFCEEIGSHGAFEVRGGWIEFTKGNFIGFEDDATLEWLDESAEGQQLTECYVPVEIQEGGELPKQDEKVIWLMEGGQAYTGHMDESEGKWWVYIQNDDGDYDSFSEYDFTHWLKRK